MVTVTALINPGISYVRFCNAEKQFKKILNKNKKMKTNVIGTVLGVVLCGSLWAQSESPDVAIEESTDKYKIETNRFWSNWFVGAGGGPQIYFGDHNKQLSLKNKLSPALDLSVGKWFTPGIGVRLMYSGLSIKGATQNGSHSTGKPITEKPWDGYWLEYQKFDFFNLHADGLVNLSNLLGGYRQDRFYNASPYLGLGWMDTWQSPRAHEVSANIGLLNEFRISGGLNLAVDVRGAFVNDRFDGEGGGRWGEGLLSATVGVTYKFKERGWKKPIQVNVEYYNNRINTLQERIEKTLRDNDELRQQLAKANSNSQVTKEVVIDKKLVVSAPQLIIFPIGKSELTGDARVNIGFLAKVIKSGDPETVYTITGYADKGTGNATLNENLSKARAQAVRDALVNEFGVSSSQLKIDYVGGVDNMFYHDPRLSRAVITEAK
jgi:outer membrane protein OmpA-like peptidoglycan-associated protein